MAWLIKFLSGFFIFNGEKVGKILWIFILFIGFTLASKFFLPKVHRETEIQTVETYVEATDNRKVAFLGIKLWRVGFGVYYE